MLGAAVTLISGTGAAQVVAIAASPLLTRLYSPSEFGAFAAAAAIVGILVTVACLAYDYAIPLPQSDATAADVAAIALLATLATSLVTAVMLSLVGSSILASVDAAALYPYVLLLALGQFAGGAVSTMSAWAVRTTTYAAIALNRLTQGLSTVGLQLLLGVLGAGVLGLLLGLVIGSLAGLMRLARSAWQRNAADFSAVTWNGVRAVAVRYRRFPMLALPSNLLNGVSLQAPLLLVAALFEASVAGQFALAQRVIALTPTLVANAVSQAFLGEASRVAREDQRQLRPLFARTTRTLAVAAILPIVAVAAVSPAVFGVVFGTEWQHAGLYVTVLAPMYYLQFVTNPTAPILDILERQDLFLAGEVARLVLLGLVVASCVAFGLDDLAAIALVSAAGCAAYALKGLLSYHAILMASSGDRVAARRM